MFTVGGEFWSHLFIIFFLKVLLAIFQFEFGRNSDEMVFNNLTNGGVVNII